MGLDGEARLAWGLAPPAADRRARAPPRRTRAEGDVVEWCPALPGIAGEVGRRIAAHGGAALFVDYGDWRSRGDTLQALRGHAPADPLEAPGEADLTAHVDFEALAARARARRAPRRLVAQGAFLAPPRHRAAGRGAGPRAGRRARSSRHAAALGRLTHPEEMGTLFKVMGAHPPSAPPPPGLDA